MPTDWDAAYRAGVLPWDKGGAAPPLLEWLAQPGHRFDGEVLVPGCGLGHDVRAVAGTKQARAVLGLDISPAAVDRARRQPASGGETYLQADLFALPAGMDSRFDWVFEHTCFCALDPAVRPDYVRAVAQALRPGGHLLAIFYLDPWKGELPPPDGGPPFAVTKQELDGLFSAQFELLEERIPTRAFPGREGRELVRLFRRVGTPLPSGTR